MTTTRPNPTPAVQVAAPAAPDRAPRVRARRNPVLLAAGAALIVAGAAGTAWLVTSMSQATPVLVTARSIPAGTVLAADDLAVAQVGTDPSVATVPAEQRAGLVGQRAATDLPAGLLLTPESTTADPIPAPGTSLVGVAVKPTQMPATPLGAGDPVTVVAPPGDSQDLPTTASPAMRATVVTTRTLDDGSVVVDVTVPTPQAGTLATWVATGRVVIVRDPVTP
jgi:hypothetical protein